MKPPLIYLPTLAQQEPLIRGLTEQGIHFHRLRDPNRGWEAWAGYPFTPWVMLEEREQAEDGPRWLIDGQSRDSRPQCYERVNSVSHFLAYSKRLQDE